MSKKRILCDKKLFTYAKNNVNIKTSKKVATLLKQFLEIKRKKFNRQKKIEKKNKKGW